MNKRIDYRPLDSKVLAVAKEGTIQDWACYIGAVSGKSHRNEWQDVADHGTKQSKIIAETLFPDFKDLMYRS